jgi:hypothetical protein
MKYLRWVGLMPSLLIVGLLGELMAPLPSGAESLPIVTLFEGSATTTFNVVAGGSNCTNSTAPPAGFLCYSITGPTTGGSISFPNMAFAANSRWRVRSVASNNQARVLVKDSDTATDNMYITGISIQSNINATSTTNVATIPGPCSVCQVGNLTLRKTFDLGVGNPAGPLSWSMHMGGNINAPDFSENVVNDRMVVTGKACFSVGCNPDAGISVGTLDTTVFTTPTTLGGQGGITRDKSPSLFGNCNTGNNKCKQTVKYVYTFTVQGLDLVNLTDSLTGCGGTCNPGNKAKGQLPACGDPNTPPDLNTNPPEEPSIFYQCAQQLAGDRDADNTSNEATGGVLAEVCGSPACIGIMLEGTPPGTSAFVGPFTLEASGDGVCPSSNSCQTQVTLDRDANGTKTFGNLALAPPAGDRTFIITGFPPGGAQGLYQLDQVTSNSTNCTFEVLTTGTGNNKTKIGARVTSLQEGHCLLEMHVH